MSFFINDSLLLQDVGWLKTGNAMLHILYLALTCIAVDQYYYGANNSIQDARVQYILDTVVANLLSKHHRCAPAWNLCHTQI